MQRTRATHFDLAGSVLHDRECEPGQHHEGRDPVSVCPAVFGLCALASLSLLFDLKGMFHRSTNLLLQVVVVVGKVLALDFGRSLSSGRSSAPSSPSGARPLVKFLSARNGEGGVPSRVAASSKTPREESSDPPTLVSCASVITPRHS